MVGFYSSFWFQQFRNAEGRPLANGTLSTFVSETDIPKPVFSDLALENPRTNPVQLDNAGYLPEMFLGDGYYRFVLKDSAGNTIITRDHIAGVYGYGTSGTAGVDDHLVIVNELDPTPGTLFEKLEDSDDITWSVDEILTGNKLKGSVNSGAGDTYKIKTTSADTADYLGNKIENTETIELSVSSGKLRADYVGDYVVSVSPEDTSPGWLAEKLENSDCVTWEIINTPAGQRLHAIVTSGGDTYKVKTTSADTAGYLSNKIKAGTGVTLTQTEDGVNGSVMWINTNVVPPVTMSYVNNVRNYSNKINVGLDYPSIQNVCQVVLSAGTWDVQGGLTSYVRTTSSGTVGLVGNISTHSGTIDMDGYDQWATSIVLSAYDGTFNATNSLNIPPRQIVVASTSTMYLVAQQGGGPFTICQMWGNITARQVA